MYLDENTKVITFIKQLLKNMINLHSILMITLHLKSLDYADHLICFFSAIDKVHEHLHAGLHIANSNLNQNC